ncbi:MAG: hypothetical protein AAGE83_05800, partial [Pseudomonadota bacterium]
MRLAWTMALGVLGLALAIGAIWLTDWLVDMLPRYGQAPPAPSRAPPPTAPSPQRKRGWEKPRGPANQEEMDEEVDALLYGEKKFDFGST